MNWELEYMYAEVSLLLLSLFLMNHSVWLERKALDVGAARSRAGTAVHCWLPAAAPKPGLAGALGFGVRSLRYTVGDASCTALGLGL